MASTRFAELLAVLAQHDVRFVIVGGVAAALAGATYATEDVDIVPSLAVDNLERLHSALISLDARYFDPAGRTILPDPRRLREHRMSLLVTRLGRLDVLHAIEPSRGYDELLPRSSCLQIGAAEVRSIDLETLIEAKQRADRPKDRIHLLLLRETLRLKQQRDSD